MKNTMYQRTLGAAALLIAATATIVNAQTTVTPNPTTAPVFTPTRMDSPGVLGNSFADINYSRVDFRGGGIDANGFVAGFDSNVPVSNGLDVGLGYSYYRENNHRNPFTGSQFDARYHQVATHATFFRPMNGVKPFLSTLLGYQWSRGDLQSFRTEDSQWVWGASGGVEIPFGTVVVTPRISYTDTLHRNSIGSWHYGAEAHHWFTEKLGGYLDVTLHEPRQRRAGPDSWTYTAGVRIRF